MAQERRGRGVPPSYYEPFGLGDSDGRYPDQDDDDDASEATGLSRPLRSPPAQRARPATSPLVHDYRQRVTEIRVRLDRYLKDMTSGDPDARARALAEMRAARAARVDSAQRSGAPFIEAGGGLPLPPPPLLGQQGFAELRRAAQGAEPQAAVAQLLAPLSGEALLLLRLLTEVGANTSLPLISEEGRRLLGPVGAQTAVWELHQRGLLLVGSFEPTLTVPADLAPLLRSVLPALAEPRALAELPPHPHQGLAPLRRTPLELALVALSLWTVRPRVTVTGTLYRRDEERLLSLLGSGFPLAARITQLQELGLLSSGDQALTVNSEAAQRLGALRPVDLLQAEAPQRFSGAPRSRVLMVLLRAGRASHARCWLSQDALERELRLGYLGGPFFLEGPQHVQRLAQRDLGDLVSFAGVESCSYEGQTYYRLWPPLAGQEETAPGGAPPPPRVHLQPSFEILVPPDAPLPTILALGRVAELKGFDQVLTMQVTRASVTQAAEQGLQASDILHLLGEAAHAGVPQNVQASVKGWVNQAGQARFAEGLVLCLREDTAALWQGDEALRTLLGRSLASGVFLVPPANRSAVEKRLRVLGVQLATEIARSDAAPLAAAGAHKTRASWDRFRDTLGVEPEAPRAAQGPMNRLQERAAAVRAAAERAAAAVRDGGRFLLQVGPPRTQPGERPR